MNLDSSFIFRLFRNDTGRIRTTNFGFANLCPTSGYSIGYETIKCTLREHSIVMNRIFDALRCFAAIFAHKAALPL